MSARSIFLASIVVSALAVAASCNPVMSDQKSALGGEAPGVRTGPFHRPGQPCTLCHDGEIGDPPKFSVAGTVFQDATSTTPASGVTVTVTDANGVTATTTTNEAGNFYFTPTDIDPKYPTKTAIASGGTTVQMQSHVGWAGSCATCHVDPAGPDSPGHVYLTIPSGQEVP